MFAKVKYLLIFLYLNSISLSNENVIDTIIYNKEPFFLNFNVGINYNLQNVNNYTFEFLNTEFNNQLGSGFGINSSVIINYSLSKNFFVGLNCNYNFFSSDFRSKNYYPIRNIDLTDTNNVQIDNVLINTQSYISFIPIISYKLYNIDSYRINLNAGLGIAISLFNSYKLNYEIISPEYVHFISNNSRKLLISEGNFSNKKNINYPLQISLSNEISLNKNFAFTSEIGFNRFLNNLLTDRMFQNNSFFLNLGLTYYFYYEKIYYKQIQDEVKFIAYDTIVEEPELSIKILKDSSEFHFKQGEEILATPPLVNSVFFNTNSSDIPDFYITYDDELSNIFEYNYVDLKKFLFIRIKEILEENPNANLTLIGYTSGEKYEMNNLELARKRAENVKDIFTKIGVETNRIKIKYDILPPKPSNMEFIEGILENQRVDILLENATYQKFINLTDYVEIAGKLKVKVDYKNITEQLLLYSNLKDDKLIITNSGIYEIPFIKRINNKEYLVTVEALNDKIRAQDTLLVSTKANLQVNSNISFNNFEAIMLFEYGSDELSKENKILLNQLNDYLKDGDILLIQGSADALGQELRNKELTYSRAKNAMDYIKSHTDKNLKIEISNNYKKFNELTPEGRFLNRAISIKVIRNNN